LGFKEKSHLIPNFVNVKEFKRPYPMSEGHGNRVVMICRLDPFKDPLTVVEAFAYVVKEAPSATLEIVGDGPLYDTVRALILELGLEQSVFLRGRQADVRPFLWRNDVLVTGNAFLRVLEAWAAGLAVVASKEETTAKLIQDGKNGVLAEPKNPQKLASALLKTIQNPLFRKSLVENGYEIVGQFDVECVSKRFLGLYEAADNERLIRAKGLKPAIATF
jgi:glycosyltransferase involved in cell wall biosynthesis